MVPIIALCLTALRPLPGLALGAITNSPLEVKGCEAEHLLAVLHVFKQMGINIERGKRSFTVIPGDRPKGCDVVTLPFPAFPTDAQAQLMALAALSSRHLGDYRAYLS